jgi:tetratricopeptide (TPR) repeat protein
MATYAATGRAPRPAELKLQVVQQEPNRVRVSASLTLDAQPARTIQEDVRFEPHFWAPEAYLGIARAFIGPTTTSPPAPPAKEDERLLAALLDLRTSTLLRENRAVSERLKASPLDPADHEDAAFLLSALTLREAAVWFYDMRTTLSRITAHLAVSRVMRGDLQPGLAGRFAEAVLVSQLERETDALARLSDLERGAGGSGTQAAWIRVLRLRNNGDWRLTAGVKTLTLAEKREEFCAMIRALDQGAAVELLDRRGVDDVPDWGRVLLSWGASVETGQRFGNRLLAQELQEIQEGWANLRDEPPPEEGALVDALNELPGGLVSYGPEGRPAVSVLDWGAWAAFEQRHLLAAVERQYRFLRFMLGLPDDAKAFAKRSRESFGGLTLYPVALLAHANDAAAYKSAIEAFTALARRSPERLPGGCWYRARVKPDFEAPYAVPPIEDRWFTPSLLTGTLYELPYRLRLRDLESGSAEDRSELRSMAPYYYYLTEFDLKKSGGLKRPSSELAAAFGATADYDSRVMRYVADAAWEDPVEFGRQQGKLCRLIPEECFRLGWRLADLGQTEKARAVYQDGIDRARDSVAAANSSLWLVDYYFDHGQKAKALKLAESAAGTYSGGGLRVMARLMERMGRLDDAELYYGRLLERYEKKNELLGFFYRQARVAKNAAYEKRFQAMLPEVFPSGLETLDRAKLAATPADGVLMQGETEWTRRFGIPRASVIVALDGFRVRTLKEYEAVREFTPSPEMALVVWRGKSYDDVKVTLLERRFYADMGDFQPRAK